MIFNLEKIHPLKREKLLHGLQFVEEFNKNNNNIDKIIVFGSAIRDDCTEDSDIDICFFSKLSIYNIELNTFFGEFPFRCDNVCDIIPFNMIKSSLKDHILNNGVVVYEYSKD